MEDYPRTLLEMERRYSSDEDCRDYLSRYAKVLDSRGSLMMHNAKRERAPVEANFLATHEPLDEKELTAKLRFLRTDLATLRWPEGFICPGCDGRNSFFGSTGARQPRVASYSTAWYNRRCKPRPIPTRGWCTPRDCGWLSEVDTQFRYSFSRERLRLAVS